jgi:Uma2 family endonuclease
MVMPAPPPLAPDPSRRDWTVVELRAIPDDGSRYEVVDGELLVTPAPSWMHQEAIGVLYLHLAPYAIAIGLRCILAPAEVAFSTRRSVEPDLFVIPVRDGRPAATYSDVGQLLLAVEVVSPGSARADRYLKRRLYQSEAVAEYWVIDAEHRFVERWRPGDEEPEVRTDALIWAPREGAEPLVIDLRRYFARVHGEGA